MHTATVPLVHITCKHFNTCYESKSVIGGRGYSAHPAQVKHFIEIFHPILAKSIWDQYWFQWGNWDFYKWYKFVQVHVGSRRWGRAAACSAQALRSCLSSCRAPCCHEGGGPARPQASYVAKFHVPCIGDMRRDPEEEVTNPTWKTDDWSDVATWVGIPPRLE